MLGITVGIRRYEIISYTVLAPEIFCCFPGTEVQKSTSFPFKFRPNRESGQGFNSRSLAHESALSTLYPRWEEETCLPQKTAAFFIGFLRGGGVQGGGNLGTLRIPRENWGTLGKIREITTNPPLRTP